MLAKQVLEAEPAKEEEETKKEQLPGALVQSIQIATIYLLFEPISVLRGDAHTNLARFISLVVLCQCLKS